MYLMNDVTRDDLIASFETQKFVQAWGARLTQADGGMCRIELPGQDWFRQHLGWFHGGLVAGLADTAATYAVMSRLDRGQLAATVEFKINFLEPAKGDCLEASAHVLRAGRKLAVAHAVVHCDERIAADFTGTFVLFE